MTQTTADADMVTLGDKRVETSNFDRYKGRKGITDRIAIISSRLIRAYSYFYEGGSKKVSFKAPTNPETLKFVKEQLGEPAQYFGLVLFHYQTDDAGDIIEPEKLKGKVKVWRISETRYEELSALHKSWPLLDGGFDAKQVDLSIKCTEEQYQRMNFTPCPDAHWKKKQAWYDALKDKESKAMEKAKQALGRQMTDAEIMELLDGALPSQTGSTDNAGDIDLSDIVDDD